MRTDTDRDAPLLKPQRVLVLARSPFIRPIIAFDYVYKFGVVLF